MTNRYSLIFFACLILVWIYSIEGSRHRDAQNPNRHEFSQPHMGTTFRILLYARTPEIAEKAAHAAFHRIKQLEDLFSDYKGESELMRLCRQAGQGPQTASPELLEVLRKSKQWSERSDGAFDVTVGPLITLWRRSRRTRELPKKEQIRAAQALMNFQNVHIDEDKKTIALTKPLMKLDLGGIAKGYAADEAQKVLKEQGIASALVAAGGDICVSARPPGTEGWVITVAPLEKHNQKFPARLILENQAVSTSGDLEQFVEINNVRYSHIVDPKTGLGLVGRMSATVVAGSATDCDAAATAVCVLGPEKGLAMIDKQPNMSCLFMRNENGAVKLHPSKLWPNLKFKPTDK